ncbi:hypothetical protein [Rodentibacter haemolyticus]|uniref:Uncharacterized protein n=1 Tax=Rodentibacter haemolyticus TaxID=2778911 RepID=A0ABX6UX46_9PAST|nr:hypothetical protein [Rodentibacter haemolyticus]QPB42014.1 hypothetical protein IHV77_08805 [Rodentibacter haemolyticus]
MTIEQQGKILSALTPKNSKEILKKTCMNVIVPGFEQYFHIKIPYSKKSKGCDCYAQSILDEFSWNEVKLIAIGKYDSVYNRQNRVDKVFHSCFL